MTNYAPVVLVTEPQFARGREVFSAADGLDVRVAPTAESDLADLVRKTGCRAVIVGTQPYTGKLYEALDHPEGALIARYGIGHDSIDKTLAARHRIVVTNTIGVLEISVAEHTLALIGALARHIPQLDADLRGHQFAQLTGQQLYGKTLVVIGFGAIGRRVCAMAHFGFGMRCVAVDIRSRENLEQREGRSLEQICATFGVEQYTTDTAKGCTQGDVLSLHLPANPATRGYVDATLLAHLKPGALLVNTSRGQVVDESALYDALAEGRLAGAALDVFAREPYRPAVDGKDLRALSNTVLTPHVASNTREASLGMARACLDNCRHFFAGHLHQLTRIDAG